MSWEALPKRKKAKLQHRSDTSDDFQPESISPMDAITERIAENIAARAKINREHTTLESKDGCAADHYECRLL